MADLEKLKDLLNHNHEFPCEFTFKFIVPKGELEVLRKIVDPAQLNERPSKNGNYTSLTVTKHCRTCDEVLNVYHAVKFVKGIVSL